MMEDVGETGPRPRRRSSFRLANMTSNAPSSSSKLARGSSKEVSAVSKPRNRVDTPVSVFQLDETTRQSQLEVTRPRPKIDNGRAYAIAIIALLTCTVAVLAVLLLVL